MATLKGAGVATSPEILLAKTPQLWQWKSEAHHEGTEGEQRYSSTLSLSSALDMGGRVVNATSGTLYPQEREPVPIVYEAGWASGVWKGTLEMAECQKRKYGNTKVR